MNSSNIVVDPFPRLYPTAKAVGFRLYFRNDSFTKEVTVGFLQTLQEKSGKNFIMVLDQAPHFIGNKIKDFVEETAIDVAYFPAGSPDLNPTETCWRQFRKTVENQYFGSLDELRAAIRPALGSIDPS
ncbi:transposase [Natronoarchaeum sp. GCM10025703]|uniref:transposase n=1 Tax=unclassified Natronoarchaeum TaxID=2620183 RepID=UPI0036064D0B